VEQGRILQRRGNLDPAEKLFKRCREIALADPRCKHCEPELLYSLGGLQFERNALDNAAKLFEDSLSRFRAEDDLKGMAKVSLGLGLADMRRGRREEAMTHIQEAIASAEQAGITDVLSAALNNLSSLQRSHGDNDASINSLKRSLEIRRNVGDRLGFAICVNNLSRAFWYAGDLHNAVETARDAHDRFQELGDKKGVFLSGSNLGGFLLYHGDVEDARVVLEENLERAREMQNWRAVVDTLQSLAILHRAAGEPKDADIRLQEGLRRLADITDASLCVTFLTVHAENCLQLGRREAAQDAIRECLDRLAEVEGREAHGWLQIAQSEFCFQDGEIEGAKDLALAAFKIFETSGSRLDTAVANRQLARIHREMGPDWVDRTERHFQLASESLEAMGARMQLALTLVEEARLWSQLEEIEESLYCLEEASRLFRECGAPRRVEEVKRQIESLDT
jgi:tetratricopeptide (TPR) repeat protein